MHFQAHILREKPNINIPVIVFKSSIYMLN